jgi:hypothetical protein
MGAALLAQPYIQPHRGFADFGPAERRGGRHALEIRFV